jgi:hypothetical protein
MIQRGFDITITPDSVDARQDDSTTKPGANRRDGIFLICGAIFVFSFMMFGSRHRMPNAWNNLTNSHWPSFDFVLALFMAILATGLSGSLFLNGVRRFFPLGAWLHCDRSTLTISKVPWFNLQGQWKSQSFPTSNVAEFKFCVTEQNLYGFRFRAGDCKYEIFIGLEAPEADEILKGLQRLGVDVVRDPSIQEKIDKTQSDRRLSTV